MTMKEKGFSYVRQTIAMFKGDSDKSLAEKNYRIVMNGIDTQIALAKGAKFQKEEAVSQAEDALNVVKFPTVKIEDTDRYFERVNQAQERLDNAKQAVKDIEDSIKKYESLRQEFSEEVESPTKEEEKK